MRGSHEKVTPPEFAAWLALTSSDWEPTYPFPGDIRRLVVDALNTAQRGLCVYCGRRLHLARPGQFHIEHFRPRSRYPGLETDLGNLFLSCGSEGHAPTPSQTCGHAKADQFDETSCIEPGTILHAHIVSASFCPAKSSTAAGGDTPVEFMITMLNLNHPELRKDREDILGQIDREGLDLSDFVDPVTGIAQSYAHVFCEHLGTVIP